MPFGNVSVEGSRAADSWSIGLSADDVGFLAIVQWMLERTQNSSSESARRPTQGMSSATNKWPFIKSVHTYLRRRNSNALVVKHNKSDL